MSWYSSTAGVGAGDTAGSEEDVGASLTVQRFAALTGLQQRNPMEVLAVLSDAADDDVELTRDEFLTAFRDRVLTAAQRDNRRVTELLSALFDLFDADADGIVSCFELAAGVAQLCTGTHSDKAEAAFTLLDANCGEFSVCVHTRKL